MTNSQPRILILDNDIGKHNFLFSILVRQNFDVRVTNTLEQAKNCFREYHPSMIFLDQYVPDGPGIDLIPLVRSFDENIKIIVISEDVSGAIQQNTFGENNIYFLSRPFSLQSVSDLLAAMS